jgi:hypothetical protein
LTPSAAVSAVDGVWQEIEALSEENRRSRSPDVERQLLQLRHQAGIELCRHPARSPEDPTPDFKALKDAAALPEITPERLSPELLRAAILSHGALLVRGLVGADAAAYLAQEIDRVFEVRAAGGRLQPEDDGYYEEFEPDRYELQVSKTAGAAKVGLQAAVGRWPHEDSGIWAADSPKLMFDMLETFEEAGLRRLAREYLGEPPAISMQKCTLRRQLPPKEPRIPGWHQDGRFLGDVRALNVWLSLSHCGDDAPGLDLVPRRLDYIVPTGTEGAAMAWVVSPATAEELAGDRSIMRPVFEPGDVVLFDHLYLHATGSDPSMTKPRYAVESWFFGPSAFPENVYEQGRTYVPLAA